MSEQGAARGARTVITLVMNLLWAWTAVVLIGLIVHFFGVLSSTEWGRLIVPVTKAMTIPFGLKDIRTPYHGFFSLNMTGTILVALVGEWVLSLVRRST